MKHTLPITVVLLILFATTQVIGLFVVQEYIDIEKTKTEGQLVWQELPSIAGVELERPDLTPQQTVVFVAIALIIGTALFFLLLRWKAKLFIKAWFFIAILLCIYISLGAFLPGTYAFVIALLLTIGKIWKPTVLIHNLSELLLYPGLAALFVPILSVSSASVMLILLSGYDMYAVWKSKHMIALVKAQAEQGIFAGLSVPYNYVQSKKSEKKIKKQVKIEAKTAILGGGDVGFPLLFTGTIFVYHGFTSALFIVLFTTASLGVLFFLAEKNKFYPALPILTAGCFAGYALLMLV